MPTGTVKKWFDDKGFGFIGPDDGGDDVFVHVKSLDGTEYLEQGAAVEYEVKYDERRGKYQASSCRSAGGGGGGDGYGPMGGKGGGYDSSPYGGGGGGYGKGKDGGKGFGKGKDGGKGY